MVAIYLNDCNSTAYMLMFCAQCDSVYTGESNNNTGSFSSQWKKWILFVDLHFDLCGGDLKGHVEVRLCLPRYLSRVRRDFFALISPP
jgi:hypothetical protein